MDKQMKQQMDKRTNTGELYYLVKPVGPKKTWTKELI